MRALEALLENEFFVAVGPLPPPPSLHVLLSRMSHVLAVRKALDGGEVSEEDIRGFVGDLLAREFKRGSRFSYDLTLAALAVALECRATGFAEEYLRDLSRLELAEMPYGIRVARECLVARAGLVRNELRTYRGEGASAWRGLNPRTRCTCALRNVRLDTVLTTAGHKPYSAREASAAMNEYTHA